MLEEVFRFYQQEQVDPGYQGPFEERYCSEFCAVMGGGFADAVSTGTAAVHVALCALDLPQNSEVLISPITDPGSVNAVIHAGLRPKLVDSRPGSYNVGPDQIAARIGPDTRAALVVHSAGQACEIDEIVRICHAKNIRVVEDCSQAHLARWKEKPVGTFGDIAAFSTMYRKASITGPCGGVVFTRDEALYRMALAWADRGKTPWIDGFDEKDPNQFLFPALNFHANELSCGIGLASLRRLPETIAARMRFVQELDRLNETSKLCRTYGWTEGDSPFFYPIRIDISRLPGNITKTTFANFVEQEGIGLNPHYKYLLADWEYLKPYLADSFETPNARAIRDRSFNLFLNEHYGEREVEDIIAAIIKVENALIVPDTNGVMSERRG